MTLDLSTLQLLKHRAKYNKLINAVPVNALSVQTQIILKDYGRWFREFDGAEGIDFGLFPAWFKSIHPAVKDEAMAVYNELFKRASQDVPEHIEQGLAKRWLAAETAMHVTAALEKWNAGEEVDLIATVRARVDEYDQRFDKKVKDPQVRDPIEDLLDAEDNDWGIPWPWRAFNEHIKPMVGGDFIVVAMRPDKGKSTACAQIATHAAAHMDKLWPGERRDVMWLNNEGPGKRIVMRCFQAAGGWTVEEMSALSKQPCTLNSEITGKTKYKTKLREQYSEAIGGRMGALRVFDIHGFWSHEIEDLLAAYKPGLVIFDMIDNVKFGGELSNNGQRTDQILEAMYQWARLLAVKHDCAIIANSQLSADADGVQWPTLTMLKDSKTGKQGAADVILCGGALNDVMLANSRYWSTTKNKKVRTGKSSSPHCELLLQGDRARYIEAPA